MARTLTHADAITRDLAEVTTRMRQGGFMSPNVSVVLKTDGDVYWLAFVRDGATSEEFVRTTSVIGRMPRDAARYVSGYLTSVCEITGQTVFGCDPA
jgi:hypothetical protein